MSSFRDLVKQVNEKKKTDPNYYQTKSDEKDEKKVSNFKDLVNQVNSGTITVGSGLNGSQVNSWYSGVKGISKEGYDFLSKEGYKAPSADLIKKIDTYLSQASDVGQYIRSNRNAFDNYDEVINNYNDTVNFLRSLRGGVDSSNKYYSQWDDEAAYIKGSTETSEERQKRYESNKQEIDVLTDIYNDGYTIDNWYREYKLRPWDSSKEEVTENLAKYEQYKQYKQKYGSHAGIGAAIENLKAENTKYERGEGGYISKTVDDYYEVTQNTDFSVDSQKRDYVNPTKADIEKADAMNDSSTWYWDANGVYRDAFGNKLAVDANNTWYNPASQNTKITDKLALYLNTSEDERVQASIETHGEDGIWSSVMKEGYGGAWEYLTDQEIGIYYYLLNENPESAYKYLSDMETELNRRRTREQTGEWYDSYDDANLLEKIALNIATVPSQFVSSLAGSIDNAVNTLQGNEINPYSIAHGGMHFSQTVRGATAADMDKTGFKIPVLDYSLGDIYQVGMSRLDSALATGLTGGSGTVILGMGAAQNEAYRLYQAGASAEQATWGALTSGAAEVVFEYYSFDKLVKLGDSKTIGKFVKNALIQAGIEASEEAFTEISNIVTNAVILGSQSDLNQLYEANGEDWLKTGLGLVQKVSQSAFGGFLGGFGAGATHSGQAYIDAQMQFADTGETIRKAYGGVDALKKLADDVAGVSDVKTKNTITKQAAKVTDKVATGIGASIKNTINDTRAGRLHDTVMTANTAANKADIATILEMNRFSSKDAKAIADAVVALANGDQLTAEQAETLNAYKNNDHVKQLFTNFDLDDRSVIGKRNRAIAEFEKDVNTGLVVTELRETTAQAFAPTGEYEVSKSHKALRTDTNEEIDIKGIYEVSKGKLILELADGSTVDAKNVSFASESDALIYEAVANLGDNIDAKTAQRLIEKYDGSNATVFSRAMAQAYTYGFYGIDKSELTGRLSLATELTEEQRNYAYGLGEKYRGEKDIKDKANAREELAENVKKGKTKAPGEKGLYYRDKDGNTVSMDTYLKNSNVVLKNDVQKTGLEAMRRLAETLGVRINVFESWQENGKTYYLNQFGKKTEGNPNGFYDTLNGEIYIALDAGSDFSGTMLFTIAHELTHQMRQWSPEHFTQIAKIVFAQAGFKGDVGAMIALKQKTSAKKGKPISYDVAMEEVVADAMETILKDGKVFEFMQELKQKDRTTWQKVKAWFKNLTKFLRKLEVAYGGRTANTEEGRRVAAFAKETREQIERIWAEGALAAGENYQSSLTPGEEGTIVNENGDPVAHATEDGTVQLSMRTYEEEGRDAFQKYLEKCVKSKRLTQGEMQEMMDGIEDIYKTCKEFKDKYAPFSSWSDAAVVRDTYGKPVFSVVTPNGDYKMNLDFSLVCKKRRTLDAVFNEMSRRGIIDDFELGQKSVVKINEIIRKYGLETACALCFVDAKRFRQASMADSFTRLYNELVESLVPEDQRGSIEHFNFSGYDTIAKVENGIHTWDASKLDFTHLDEVMKNYGDGTVEYKAAKYIKSNAEGRKLLLRGDFMSSQGFDAVKTQNPDVLKLYNSKKGTGGPKAAFGDVQYMNEVIKKARFWTAKKAYAVGGIRIQSFSDYVPRMVFDYVQMIYDLAATKLPAHAYTKEALFVKQFGLTGVKINMSLIPAIAEGGIAPGLDANGNYVWAGESFDFETAKEIQNAEGYSENCGTICVGVSYQHILKLLSDPDIRMVIPYHKSGLNPIVAHMNKIAEFTDYTTLKTNPGGCQNTMDKNGNKVEVDFNFNEALRKTGDPKATVRQYLNWCAENEYTPRFAEFAWHENYYKLIEDFTLYDKDGKYVPQRGVKAVFPNESSAFGSMKSLIQEGLQEDSIVEGKRDSNLSAIVDEIQETLPKTEAEISEEQVAQADRDLEADTKFSERASNKELAEMGETALYIKNTDKAMSDRAREILASVKPKWIGNEEKAYSNIETVQELFNELNADKDIQALAERVFKVARDDHYGYYGYSYPGEPKSHIRLAMDFVGKGGIPNGVAGQFRKDTIWGHIVFSYDYFMDDSVSPQRKASTILHEVIHAVTCGYIENAYNWSKVKQGQWADPTDLTDFNGVDERIKAGIELIDVFEQVRFAPTESGKQLYGQLTAYEMVAEMANVEFRNFLKEQSLWNRIVDAIKRIFGIPKTTAYDAVSDALERILTETTKDADAQRAKNEARKDNVRYSERVLMGSLFSGGGTLEAGLVYQMLDKEFAVEYNKQIAATYTDNHGKEHMFVGDVRDFNSKDKQNVFYLHASPVCKNFSPASHSGGETTLDIVTAQATARVLEEQMPQAFTVENVKRYIGSEAYKLITDKLTELGYKWDVDVYKASDYGNATKRERMIIRAVKDGDLPAKPEKASSTTSWGEATRDLWETDLIPSTLVKSKIEAIRNTPELKNLKLTKLDRPLMIYDTTKSKKVTYAWADELAPTLTTKCGDARIIMPDGKVYAPTPKFMGRIQGLPDDYKYPKAKTNAFKIIGNGIPTQLTKAVIGGVLDSAYEQTHDGKVLYQDRAEDSVSNRSLLANAFEGIATPQELPKIQEYKDKVALINAEEKKLRELNEQIKELSFAKGKRDTKKINELRFDATQASNRINTYDKQLLHLEASKPLQDVLEREKKRAYKKAEQRGKEALAEYKSQVLAKQKETADKWRESRKTAVAKARETSEKRDARAKLQKLVLDTVKWISYPAKTDVKCPDILKKPYESFLQCIDLSSKRLANGGEATKNDLRLANAMGSLATALDKIMISQDPTQDVDKVLDTGYLDLPVDFVQKLRDMTENIKSMMVEGEYVVNTMTAAEVRQLSQIIRTLNHSIKTMSKLYANLRFANVEALGVDTMEFMDALGEIEKTGGMGDFVKWDNALPYYAFKRFGKGGESVFEGLMDAQDKLAFLAKEIFAFRDKAWTSKEASEWSEDTHTIELPKGGSLTLTTADAMSIYCLSRRDQGLQHLLGGGTRVLGLQKGSKKAKDSRSLLTIEDISAINSSLTDRQRAVAEAIQEFMSTVCSEWGNEISMKRFLTREFTEKFYFPIESNDENLPVKDPAAQQSDLFRLLNISATKPLTPGANNEVIIRNIFDVFTGHASDMARLNAFGMGLLDYMKWLNYREKATNTEGQVKVRGVRKSMQGAYGDSAMRYVLNLVKDVNGRASDGGDPNILMKWMRAAKTASVGSSLRVATLQITSYPRAALVLSPKSLALGLTKMPNIEKAKKYCGIALWKSFGFYDTNISRSIEDQMKGVTDVKQKLIELSLKGAELGDAITWGALWNACEYEVAQTTKNKVGSEEFYQEVGKKLREVVYRTQVVDSNLTRSQIMRSKRGMAQEAAAFMSEPTLSANILMDAGFEFGLEKRRTGSAKAAWAKTGSYIGRAIAVYSIGQLAAALMEGLWDAWRDDDDEEFGQKFLDEFIENLALDLVPFNKIPIVSDVFEGALAMFDVGFYSADKMSSAWITQALSAADAWKDVFGGKSSTTAYNAIYKTTRALSSYFGVSVSGAMREVVALWNNTAGAYDSTLKIRQYDLSEADLGVELYEALISGNTRQADSLKAQFDDVESVQAALRKAIMDNYSSGGINRDTALRHLVEFSGMEEDDAYWKVEEWEYEKEFDDEFRKYNEFYEAVQTGKNLKAVTKKYTDHGVDAKTLASQITSYFKPLYKEMSKAERAALKGYLLNAYALLGYDRDKKSKDIDKWLED